MCVLKMTRIAMFFSLLTALQAPSAWAQRPFLPDSDWSGLRAEGSGASPYENLRALTRLHRVPATAEFDQAADYVLERAKEYGLQDVRSEQFSIAGKINYGLMRSHVGWKVQSARLWQVEPEHTLVRGLGPDPHRPGGYRHRRGGCSPE